MTIHSCILRLAVVSIPAALMTSVALGAAASDALDSSVRPGDDFFQYANGAWLASHEIPADRASWGTFEVLIEETTKRTAELLDGVAKQKPAAGTDARKVADFYSSFMDEAG